MVKVGSKSILEHQLDAIPTEMVNKLVIITGYREKILKDFVQSLDIPYPVIFHSNERYRETHCTYSLLKARQEILEGFVSINADLLFTRQSLLDLLQSKHANAICARQVKDYRTDLEQIRVDKDKIVEWKLKTETPNDGEVMGPLKMSVESAQLVFNYCDNISQKELFKLPCFTMFSLLLDRIDFHAVFLKDDTWGEIDTIEDLEKAKKHWSYK